MKTIVKSFILIVLCGVFGSSKCQNIWVIDTIVDNEELKVLTNQFTGMTIRVYGEYSTLPIFSNSRNQIIVDEHINNEGFSQSILYVKEDSMVHLINCKGLHLQLIFQWVPLINSSYGTLDRRKDCEVPTMIPPAIWRTGLTIPNPNPIATDMRHCIVHHSAGGNGNVNYTSLVRNYYVQQTQVNGWDDIGYNFLVSYDGTIFIGRDKQNLQVPQYNVQGAHFCSKNAGTCGICLIGNFNTIEPSDTMIGSLERLMAWVFYKEMRNAKDSTPHPTPIDAVLNHIAGHRQGCATVCPGNNVFTKLDSVRNKTEAMRLDCLRNTGLIKLQKSDMKFTLVANRLKVYTDKGWSLYAINGTLIFKSVPSNSASSIYLKPNIYLLRNELGQSSKIQVF